MARKGDGDEKKRYEFPTFVYDPYHINLWTGDYLNKRQKYSAAIRQYNAAENNANVDREMIPIYEERSKAFLHTWNLKATDRNVSEGLQLQPTNSKLMLSLGDLYYQKNQFEDALGAYYRGHFKKPRPPNFIHGIWVSTGTVLNALGSKVGNIMSNKRLGSVVVNMKKKELGLTQANKDHIEIARRRKVIKVRRIKDSYNDIYLKRAAKDEALLSSCLHQRGMFLANKKHNKLLRNILDNTLDKLKAAKIALWKRKPLYTREQDVLSNRLKEFISKKQEYKKANLEIVVNLRIAALDQAFNQDKCVECFKKGDDLRSFLFEQSDNDLPSKQDSMLTVISILGDLLIKKKTLLPNISANENDTRVMVLFGFRKPKTLTQELYSDEAFHPKILRLKKFLDSKLADLKHTTDILEKAYLCHEIGVAYSFKDVAYVTRQYAREAIFASKAARDRKWIMNSVFLLARSEIQLGNMEQGRICLNGLMAAADKFNYIDIKYLAIRAYELTTMAQAGPKELDTDEKENRIIKAMSSQEYKFTAMKYLQKARTCPPDERFPIQQDMVKDKVVDRVRVDEENIYYQALMEAKRRATLQITMEHFEEQEE